MERGKRKEVLVSIHPLPGWTVEDLSRPCPEEKHMIPTLTHTPNGNNVNYYRSCTAQRRKQQVNAVRAPCRELTLPGLYFKTSQLPNQNPLAFTLTF
jgi:hypothetical protein